MQHYCPDAPGILVGCKTDLREDGGFEEIISTEQGQKLSVDIGAAAYCECSALTQIGMKEGSLIFVVYSVNMNVHIICFLDSI